MVSVQDAQPLFDDSPLEGPRLQALLDVAAGQAVRNIRVPLHLIRGRMSELVTEDSVAAFRSLAPRAHFTDVAGARHMVAGDCNDLFVEAVVSFLRPIREQTPA